MSNDCPSVTRILADLGLARNFERADPAAVQYAAVRGRAVHLAISYHVSGDLDEASLHPEVRPYFAAYLGFRAMVPINIIETERELVHSTWRFVGHPDALGTVEAGWIYRADSRWVLDWKSGSVDLEAARLQLAAYKLLYEDANPKDRIDRCLVVQFEPSGTFKMHDVTDGEAEQTFLAAVLIWRELKRRGKL